jgi:hypothetical protein
MKRIVASEHELELPPIEERGLPGSLRKVLQRSLAFDAADRYQTAIEFQADLEKVLEEMGRRVSTREIGKFVADEFADDRKRLESIIDEEIKRLDAAGPRGSISLPTEDVVRVDMPAASFTPTLDSPGARTTAPTAVSMENSATVSVSELVNAAAKRRTRPVAWLAVMLGVLAVVAIAGLVIRERARSNSSEAAATPASALTMTEAKPNEVRIKISASPSSAILYLNGRRLGPNPYSGTLPRSDKVAEIRAESDGYEKETRTVELDADVDLEIALKASSASPPVASSKSSGGKRGPAWPAPHAVAAAPEPEKPAPPPATATEMKPPPRNTAGVKLDTGNPWDKK